MIFGKGWNWPPKMVSPLFIHLSHCSIHTRSMFTIMNMYKTACFYYSSTLFILIQQSNHKLVFATQDLFLGPHIHIPPPKKTPVKQDSQLSQQNSQSSVCELLQNTELSSQPEPMTSDVAAGSSDLAASTGNTALAVPEARAPLSSRLTAAAMRSSPQVKEKKRAPNGT